MDPLPSIATTPTNDRYAAARTFIAQHCWPEPWWSPQPLRQTDVAEHLGISRRQLQRILREGGDTTFREVLREAVMERAEEALLRSPTTPVSIIARRAGYEHAGHFSKVFKQHRKASPARLRRKRLGPRRVRRVGGLRGTALHDGRLSPTEIRAREQFAATEVRRMRTWLDQSKSQAQPGDDIFGYDFAEMMLEFRLAEVGRLRQSVEALDRRAWRERTGAGRKRRAGLLSQIDRLQSDMRAYRGRSKR